MDHVWAGLGEPGSARLRRADQRRHRPDRRQGALEHGYLPTVYQGVQCRTAGDPILYVSDPKGMDRDTRRHTLDALRTAQRSTSSIEFGDPETLTRISQYELAFRMQMAVPEVMDIKREPEKIRDAVRCRAGRSRRSPTTACWPAGWSSAACAYVQLFDWGWDCHGTGNGDDIVEHLPKKCLEVDRPIAALLADLKQRGLARRHPGRFGAASSAAPR